MGAGKAGVGPGEVVALVRCKRAGGGGGITWMELAGAIADLAEQVLAAAPGGARKVDDDVVVLAADRLFHEWALQAGPVDLRS